jgi:hypothetical protein
MRKIKDNAYNNGYKVKDVRDGNKMVNGIPVITFVNYVIDWKQQTNATDKSADMVLRIIGKLVCKFKHHYPTTWRQILSFLEPDQALDS